MKFNNLNINIIPRISYKIFNNEHILIVYSSHLLHSLNVLKKDIGLQFKLLSSISGVDYLIGTYRFNVVYELISIVYNSRIKVKVFVDSFITLNSCFKIFTPAVWWEREIWDMFGLWFTNHPDLRRILTDYGFDNFPLRKDFPVVGFFEVAYDFKKKRIVYKPCELAQDFRKFSFENIW